jgi:adenylate cyclase
MLGKLVPLGGGAPILLSKTTLVVGRKPDCDITVPCQTVSSRHCELQFSDGAWTVRDLGSKNGTMVNNVRCEKQRVSPNDLLAFGKQRYLISYVGQPSSMAGEAPGAQRAVPPGEVDAEALAMQVFGPYPDPAPAPAPPLAAAQASSPHFQDRAALAQLAPSGGGQLIPLLAPDLLVGRHPKCDICIGFADVSAKHCRLNWQSGYWFVQDLKSSNGTFVNGERCEKKCLPPDSVLGLAKHRYAVHYSASGGPPPDEDDIFAHSLLEKAGLQKQFGGPSARAPEPADPRDDARIKLDVDDLKRSTP